MPDICTDNRFELIDKYKTKLLDSTNIETSPEEMAVIDNILFRFWQMGWLDKLEAVNAESVKHGRWLDVLVVDDDEGETDGVECSECGYTDINVYWAKTYHRFCPNCGAKMDR